MTYLREFDRNQFEYLFYDSLFYLMRGKFSEIIEAENRIEDENEEENDKQNIMLLKFF